jgi:ribosomal protein L18
MIDLHLLFHLIYLFIVDNEEKDKLLVFTSTEKNICQLITRVFNKAKVRLKKKSIPLFFFLRTQ